MNFQRFISTLLYTEENPSDSSPGFLAFLLTGNPAEPPDEIPFDLSWTLYRGFYLFLREAPKNLLEFALEVQQELEPADPSHTGFAWVRYSAKDEQIESIDLIETVAQGDSVVVQKDATIAFENYNIPFKENAPVVVEPSTGDISGFRFEYPPFPGSPAPAAAHTIHLPMTGGARGSFNSEATIGDFGDDFKTGWNVGCRYFVNLGDGVISQYYPIFELETDQQVLFRMQWDPVDQLNPDRTYLAFSGVSFKLVQESPGTFSLSGMAHPDRLGTAFRTIYGDKIDLIPLTDSSSPAKLVFDRLSPLPASSAGGFAKAAQSPPQYYLAPAGDFELVVSNDQAATAGKPYNLLCGLAGTEYIGFKSQGADGAGDILSFHPHRPAYAPRFPLPSVNLCQPNSPPVEELLLDDTYQTSWVTVSPAPAAPGGTPAPVIYYSQPHGAALYANELKTDGGDLPTLSYYQTKTADLESNSAADAFPLVPYAEVTPNVSLGQNGPATLRQFEGQIISPTRKQRILSIKRKAGVFALPAALPPGTPTKPTTTPQGLLAAIATDPAARWKSVLLARNIVRGAEHQLIFTDLDTLLQDAFQTNQQFLVITDPKLPWNIPGGTTFQNLMLIEDWPFRLLVGRGNVLGDYRNVLIFKFVSGKLSEHVKNPSNWTSVDQFNVVEAQGLAFLSQWLQDYIEQARVMADAERRQGLKESYFQNFLDIVDSETWNGILALRVHIELTQFPQELKGLLGGIDLTRFYAHHFGIEVNFVQAEGTGLGIAGNSSLFGLIYYLDAAYENQLALLGSPDRPVAAGPGDYDFKVLTLKVLFENTAVKTFESKVQVTLNRCFDDKVLNIVDPSGAIVNLPSYSIILDGAYEEHDEQSTFTFSSNSDQLFKLNSNVLGVVEIVQAQFGTLTETGGDGDIVHSRFTFAGYMNFMPATGFDLFSFGSDWIAAAPGARQGLYFSNLYLDMRFAAATPADRVFTFNPEYIAFNTERSRARPGSFYANFPLKLAGLTRGAGDKGPAQLGFLPVSVEAPFTGLKGSWNGLQLQLDLGTVGELAENAGMIGLLMGSWSPASGGTRGTYDVIVGLKLPGAGGGGGKLLSLQGVLSLSINNLQLLLGETQDGRPAYMLKMTDIALKFLGVKFPPSGNTVFYLFGDPNPGAPQNSLGWYAAYNKGK